MARARVGSSTLAPTLMMNCEQVSGEGQMRQALSIVFKDGLATPFRTVGPASVTAWFFQYSVMGFIFQLCDRALSNALSVEPGSPSS